MCGPACTDARTIPPAVQQAFVDYLEERGVTAELGEYIRLLVQVGPVARGGGKGRVHKPRRLPALA